MGFRRTPVKAGPVEKCEAGCGHQTRVSQYEGGKPAMRTVTVVNGTVRDLPGGHDVHCDRSQEENTMSEEQRQEQAEYERESAAWRERMEANDRAHEAMQERAARYWGFDQEERTLERRRDAIRGR